MPIWAILYIRRGGGAVPIYMETLRRIHQMNMNGAHLGGWIGLTYGAIYRPNGSLRSNMRRVVSSIGTGIVLGYAWPITIVCAYHWINE